MVISSVIWFKVTLKIIQKYFICKLCYSLTFILSKKILFTLNVSRLLRNVLVIVNTPKYQYSSNLLPKIKVKWSFKSFLLLQSWWLITQIINWIFLKSTHTCRLSCILSYLRSESNKFESGQVGNHSPYCTISVEFT